MADPAPAVDIGTRKQPINGGRNGGDLDARLRDVKKLLSRIDERTEKFATREDLMKLRLWVVTGVGGGIVTVILVGATVARLLVSPSP